MNRIRIQRASARLLRARDFCPLAPLGSLRSHKSLARAFAPACLASKGPGTGLAPPGGQGATPWNGPTGSGRCSATAAESQRHGALSLLGTMWRRDSASTSCTARFVAEACDSSRRKESLSRADGRGIDLESERHAVSRSGMTIKRTACERCDDWDARGRGCPFVPSQLRGGIGGGNPRRRRDRARTPPRGTARALPG